MFGRKRAHLVERAVEHLAQSGDLDDSAAHLLEPERTADGVALAATARSVESPAPAMSHAAAHAPMALAEPEPALSPEIATIDAPLQAPTATDPVDAAADFALSDQGAADRASRDEASPDEALAQLDPTDDGGGQPFVDMTSLFRAGMIDWNRVRSRVSEEFRLVQRQIVRTAFTAAGAEPGFSNLLMITSSIPGEGKSFTSLNLAACIARQRDHYVLLIDIDSKRDSFCMALGLGDAPGLLDLAANPDIDPSQVIAKTAIEHLSVLPIGIERDLGPELFASKQMTKLIQALGRRYADRLIVLDAPPTLSTSDPAALAPIVGQIMFVVEAERTQREEVESSLDLLQACPTITLLLNKVQVQTRYTFGAYSTYYTS
jgi:protein-tyrosine kinase